jgi:hypothetical protein
MVFLIWLDFLDEGGRRRAKFRVPSARRIMEDGE